MVIIQQLVMKSLALFFVLFLFCDATKNRTTEGNSVNGTDSSSPVPEVGNATEYSGYPPSSPQLPRGPPRYHQYLKSLVATII
ncbi:unnamed protein product [Nezara viridula]|uniref:Neuropeptide n=1 Tax=Nezara viridula TaxID=85310 RepID=A0A9P0HS95_NEZVI|nr:unnamed protein product [Nezara viridula]